MSKNFRVIKFHLHSRFTLVQLSKGDVFLKIKEIKFFLQLIEFFGFLFIHMSVSKKNLNFFLNNWFFSFSLKFTKILSYPSNFFDSAVFVASNPSKYTLQNRVGLKIFNFFSGKQNFFYV